MRFDLRECIESACALVARRAAENGLELTADLDEIGVAVLLGDIPRSGRWLSTSSAMRSSSPPPARWSFAPRPGPASTARVGVGSTFTLAVTLAAASDKMSDTIAPLGHVPVEGPLHVLLAEDNRVNQMVATLILAKLGHRVDIVDNGLEAVEAVQRGTYDVVLMDLEMPVLDGLGATVRIRAELPVGRQPAIVALTANALAKDRAACARAGMDSFVAKPFQPADLKRALNQVRTFAHGRR